MRVALITDGIFPYVIGGMQRHSYYVAKYLSRNKIEVDLYHTSQNDTYDIEKLEYFTEEEKKYIHSYVIKFPLPGKYPGHYLRESYQYSIKVYALLKTKPEVDFIYIKGFAGWKLLEEKKKGRKFPPVAIKLHGMNMFQKSFSLKSEVENIMLRVPARFNLKYADYVFSYGGKITECIKEIGIPSNKILEISSGIEDFWIVPPICPSVVRKFVFIGRYDKVKGIRELSDAITSLDPDISAEFHFVGPMPDKKRLKLRNCIYHGEVKNNERLKKILNACDVLICPSRSEGMPNVIIEAMAAGLAIIATDVGVINNLVSSNNGWLLADCSVKTIERSMRDAINLPVEQLLQKKIYSQEYVRKHLLWDKIVQDLICKITRIIRKK